MPGPRIFQASTPLWRIKKLAEAQEAKESREEEAQPAQPAQPSQQPKETEVRAIVDASTIHPKRGPREDRHVIIKDLVKVGQALKMPVDHFARPVVLFAAFYGHRPAATSATEGDDDSGASSKTPPACAEFCARNLHTKLLERLTEFKGEWDDALVIAAVRASCTALDAEFLAQCASAADGCSASIALLTGRRLFVARVGSGVGILGLKTEDGSLQLERLAVYHTPAAPAELERIRAAGGIVGVGPDGRHVVRVDQGSSGAEVLHLSRAFGDRIFKSSMTSGGSADAPAKPPRPIVIATPEVRAVTLTDDHLCLFMSISDVTDTLNDQQVAEVLCRRLGRPRLASGALLQMAEAGGAVSSLTSICAYLDWGSETSQEPPSKKPNIKSMQIRVRHILVKFKGCKENVDAVRTKQLVTRSLEEA